MIRFKVVDKSKKDSETSLSPVDFANVPKREIDLKSLGINVKPDPTLGNKIEGDIAVDAFSSRFRRGAVRQSFRLSSDLILLFTYFSNDENRRVTAKIIGKNWLNCSILLFFLYFF